MQPQRTPATVVVTSGGATPLRVRRCVERVVASVPGSARVAVVTTAPVPLDARTAGRVRLRRVRSEAEAKQVIAALVATDGDVVTVSADFDVSGDWFGVVERRLVNQPALTGVYEQDGHWVFAFPSRVKDLDGQQTRWSDLPGLQLPGRQETGEAARLPLTAVLITKDEEVFITGCLEAVADFVDEVVVYDTGSTDRTVDLARAAGARVVEGYWDRDFSAARNRALRHATSDWVLVVDADEYATGDPESLRLLVDTTPASGLTVPQVSLRWRGAQDGSVMQQNRLFRRSLVHYEGALHEQTVARTPGTPLRWVDARAHLKLKHFGYLERTMADRDKGARNSDVARRAFEATPVDDPAYAHVLTNYGRSIVMSGQSEEALAVLNRLFDIDAGSGTVVQAGRTATELCLQQDDLIGFDRWVGLLEERGEAPGNLAVLRARRAIAAEDPEGARALLRELLDPAGPGGGVDTWGNLFEPDGALQLLAEVERSLGHLGAAVEVALATLDEYPDTLEVGLLFATLHDAGWTMQDVVRRAPQRFLDRSLRDMVALPPEQSLAWFTAFHEVHPQDHRPVVGGCVVARSTNWLTALTWSARAAELTLDLCPLRDLAEAVHRPIVERCVAWALLADAFQQVDALQRLVDLLEPLEEDQRMSVLVQVADYAPGALGQLSTATATAQVVG